MNTSCRLFILICVCCCIVCSSSMAIEETHTVRLTDVELKLYSDFYDMHFGDDVNIIKMTDLNHDGKDEMLVIEIDGGTEKSFNVHFVISVFTLFEDGVARIDEIKLTQQKYLRHGEEIDYYLFICYTPEGDALFFRRISIQYGSGRVWTTRYTYDGYQRVVEKTEKSYVLDDGIEYVDANWNTVSLVDDIIKKPVVPEEFRSTMDNIEILTSYAELINRPYASMDDFSSFVPSLSDKSEEDFVSPLLQDQEGMVPLELIGDWEGIYQDDVHIILSIRKNGTVKGTHRSHWRSIEYEGFIHDITPYVLCIDKVSIEPVEFDKNSISHKSKNEDDHQSYYYKIEDNILQFDMSIGTVGWLYMLELHKMD